MGIRQRVQSESSSPHKIAKTRHMEARSRSPKRLLVTKTARCFPVRRAPRRRILSVNGAPVATPLNRCPRTRTSFDQDAAVKAPLPHEIVVVREAPREADAIELPRDAAIEEVPRERLSRFAYVCLFFGDRVDVFAGLMVIGHSLRVRFASPHELVLLYTSDVPVHFLAALGTLFTLRPVDDVPFGGHAIWHSTRPELWRTCVKLRSMELTMFSKVLFLDSDVLVRRPLDDLFELPTPAGVEVNSEDPVGPLPLGSRIPSNRLLDPETGALRARVNAGVLLLTPDPAVFEQLAAKALVAKCCDSFNPEEDLLTRHWAGAWTSLGLHHNHEMWRMNATSAEAASAAAVLHFSTRWAKPHWAAWHQVSDDEAFEVTKVWLKCACWSDPHDLFATATKEWAGAFRDCKQWSLGLGHDLLEVCSGGEDPRDLFPSRALIEWLDAFREGHRAW
uniref:Hexosyltransferase n=1 Tax=Noctiluca scintillans TaxID=2966 RepID=A0A7S1F6V0_NOCSC|mmetsp:Transcript_36994/g.98557  ORF Transcript_36994/g.98557 Transcript_36994/m.98557 type:complete len:448 (+) Transcript_36994:61-1404(+)